MYGYNIYIYIYTCTYMLRGPRATWSWSEPNIPNNIFPIFRRILTNISHIQQHIEFPKLPDGFFGISGRGVFGFSLLARHSCGKSPNHCITHAFSRLRTRAAHPVRKFRELNSGNYENFGNAAWVNKFRNFRILLELIFWNVWCSDQLHETMGPFSIYAYTEVAQ